MLNKESLIEIMRELGKTGVKELIVAHDRVEMRTYERGAAEVSSGRSPAPEIVSSPVPEPGLKEKVNEKPRANLVEIKAPLPGMAYLAQAKTIMVKPCRAKGIPWKKEVLSHWWRQ